MGRGEVLQGAAEALDGDTGCTTAPEPAPTERPVRAPREPPHRGEVIVNDCIGSQARQPTRL